jgi:hypothetical protein
MNHLENAIRKCFNRGGREWCGCLIPKEILALIDAGVECHPWSKDNAIAAKKKGINNPSWFYFKTTKKFEIVYDRNSCRG